MYSTVCLLQFKIERELEYYTTWSFCLSILGLGEQLVEKLVRPSALSAD